MLVKFNSEVGSLIMFGDIAVSLLKTMGMSGDLPGAMLAADIPAALSRLKAASAAAPERAPAQEESEDEGGKEPRVSLRQRAFPLIQLLTAAAKADCPVVWEEYRPKLGGLL